MYCFQARSYIIQPGNFTHWGIEGVSMVSMPLTVLVVCVDAAPEL